MVYNSHHPAGLTEGKQPILSIMADCHNPMATGHKVTLLAPSVQCCGGLNCNNDRTWIHWKHGQSYSIWWSKSFLLISYQTDLILQTSGLKTRKVISCRIHRRICSSPTKVWQKSWKMPGLRLDEWQILDFQDFDIEDEVVQHALKVEEMVIYQACKFT